MSSIRGASRRPHRQHQQSPYARPKPKPAANKSWSFTGFLSYFNPLRSREPEEEVEEKGASDEEPIIVDLDEQASPARALASRGIQLGNGLLRQDANENLNTPAKKQNYRRNQQSTSSPESPPLKFPFPQSQSPSRESVGSSSNIAVVAAYLNDRRGQTFSEMEIEGMVSLLQKSTKIEDNPEPFRFSTSPFTSGRENTPTQPDPNTARKVLKKNPNGTLRWQGGGSSRPRNRYQSPGFGTSSGPPKMKLSTPLEPVKVDHKRRRMAETPELQSPGNASTSEASAGSAPERTFPFQVSNPGAAPPPSVNGVAKKNEVPAPPRLRPLVLPTKPTQPAIPSPLRQAWGQTDSPPQSKQTKAASFMTDLIKEVTPPSKPDVSNPYQVASPVPLSRPNRKPVVKRPRAARKRAAEKEKETETEALPELTPQEIIEATVPKGSKRSRPPNISDKQTTEICELQPPPSPSLRRSPRQIPADGSSSKALGGIPHVNGNVSQLRNHFEGTEEGDQVAEKQKKKSRPSVTVEDAEDVDMASAPSSVPRPAERQTSSLEVPSVPRGPSISPTNTNKQLPNAKSNAPKEPSKLRFVYQPESSTPTPGSSVVGTPQPQPPLPLNKDKVEPKKTGPKEDAMAMDVDSLPKFSFIVPANVAGPSNSKAQQAAKSTSIFSLPTFDFSESTWKNKDSEGAASVSASTGGFNWAAAGMKAPEKSTGGSWICSECGLSNPANAVEKCGICDHPKPGGGKSQTKENGGATSSLPAATSGGGFNWAAAGMKPPDKSSDAGWTCRTCGLSNPAGAVDKCSICDAPR